MEGKGGTGGSTGGGPNESTGGAQAWVGGTDRDMTRGTDGDASSGTDGQTGGGARGVGLKLGSGQGPRGLLARPPSLWCLIWRPAHARPGWWQEVDHWV